MRLYAVITLMEEDWTVWEYGHRCQAVGHPSSAPGVIAAGREGQFDLTLAHYHALQPPIFGLAPLSRSLWVMVAAKTPRLA